MYIGVHKYWHLQGMWAQQALRSERLIGLILMSLNISEALTCLCGFLISYQTDLEASLLKLVSFITCTSCKSAFVSPL